jgi:multiple sugar transport system substrate-binding protein
MAHLMSAIAISVVTQKSWMINITDSWMWPDTRHWFSPARPHRQLPATRPAAAGAHQLPDVFASDVVFVPKYTSQNLFLDISDRIAKPPFKNALAPSHMKLGTRDGRQYTLPHTIDSSVLFYNKVLYKKAGLDPERPPTTLKEFAEQATTIRKKLGGGTYGTFFGGACGGCYVFTYWPSIWAAGGNVMDPQGTRSTIDSPVAQQVFEIYHDL